MSSMFTVIFQHKTAIYFFIIVGCISSFWTQQGTINSKLGLTILTLTLTARCLGDEIIVHKERTHAKNETNFLLEYFDVLGQMRKWNGCRRWPRRRCKNRKQKGCRFKSKTATSGSGLKMRGSKSAGRQLGHTSAVVREPRNPFYDLIIIIIIIIISD